MVIVSDALRLAADIDNQGGTLRPGEEVNLVKEPPSIRPLVYSETKLI